MDRKVRNNRHQNTQDVDAALEYARRYFAGEHGDEPNWEYLSAGDATAVSDISHFLPERE